MGRPPKLGDRVIVASGAYRGGCGVVIRMLRRREPASWVRLDELHPTGDHPFRGSGDERATDALVQWADMMPPVRALREVTRG